MKKKTLIFILLSLTLVSCATKNSLYQKKDILENKNKQEDQYNKFLQDFKSNKLNETELNQIYLIAKTYEYNNELEKAEKLFEIVYKFSHNITTALNLIQTKIKLKKISEAKAIAEYMHIIFPNDKEIIKHMHPKS